MLTSRVLDTYHLYSVDDEATSLIGEVTQFRMSLDRTDLRSELVDAMYDYAGSLDHLKWGTWTPAFAVTAADHPTEHVVALLAARKRLISRTPTVSQYEDWAVRYGPGAWIEPAAKIKYGTVDNAVDFLIMCLDPRQVGNVSFKLGGESKPVCDQLPRAGRFLGGVCHACQLITPLQRRLVANRMWAALDRSNGEVDNVCLDVSISSKELMVAGVVTVKLQVMAPDRNYWCSLTDSKGMRLVPSINVVGVNDGEVATKRAARAAVEDALFEARKLSGPHSDPFPE